MRCSPRWLLSLAFSVCSIDSLAYSSQGHEMAGAIADALLTPTAKQQVTQLLGGDLTLKTAAIWPDCAKSVKGTDFKYKRDEYTPKDCVAFESDAEKQRMEDYVSRNYKQCGYQASDGKELCHQQYHFTDVAIEHDAYRGGYRGTSTHDVVASITAAYLLLAGGTVPPESQISIKDKREALLMLAHFVGDIHQPLHVGAVYLDADDKPVDPDAAENGSARATSGGNDIADGSTNLHADWDNVPKTFLPSNTTAFNDMLQTARGVDVTPGDPSTWSTAWASQTLLEARKAFAHLTFTETHATGDDAKPFAVDYGGKKPSYDTAKSAAQRRLLASAGRRLALMVNTALDGPSIAITGVNASENVTLVAATPVAPMAAAPNYIASDNLQDVGNILAPLSTATTLVVFDIDDTLLAMPFEKGSTTQHTFFGSDTWFSWQVGMDKPKRVACLFDFIGINYETGTMIPTPHAADAVRGVSSDKLILTARNPYYREGTERELSDAHIPSPAPITARPNAIVLSPDLSTAMTYINGIFMTRGYNKGEALMGLLKELGVDHKYTDVVLVDDGWKNQLQMNAAVSARGIQFHGLLYTGVKTDPSKDVVDGPMKPFVVTDDQARQATAAYSAWRESLKSAYPERALRFEKHDCAE